MSVSCNASVVTIISFTLHKNALAYNKAGVVAANSDFVGMAPDVSVKKLLKI
jgi:hypothetical protein